MTTATLNQPRTDQIAKDEKSIRALFDRMSKAHHDKNVAALTENYAPGAAIYSLAPPLLHKGLDPAEKQAWFDTWEGPITIEPRDFQITVSGDTAFAHGYMRLAGNKIGVDKPISFWMRETLCLERKDHDTWRIVHEHTSVPFYMDETLRPAIDLQPE
jgi:ketosteroid isomerase-like protein